MVLNHKDDSPTFKLIDFGLSEELKNEKEWDKWMDNGCAGTWQYFSPQLACLKYWRHDGLLALKGCNPQQDGAPLACKAATAVDTKGFQTCERYGEFQVVHQNKRDKTAFAKFSPKARPGGSDDLFALGAVIFETLATKMDASWNRKGSFGLTPFDARYKMAVKTLMDNRNLRIKKLGEVPADVKA
eukprot:CAMPEP_0168502196 /NCGR_PEP_ID=MMETSP0228-20121227/75206_1 /TAXON_ID=133427 /ORGANISM="Protoceratium reticulatum, Strain CCCM 535 (=CCMP 1889)" /LENGTH=185 /DNA_ID=CAMNT_0008519195 /DNA_START=47 /DNA_END=600 /DNA_ORIENTATION=-